MCPAPDPERAPHCRFLATRLDKNVGASLKCILTKVKVSSRVAFLKVLQMETFLLFQCCYFVSIVTED